MQCAMVPSSLCGLLFVMGCTAILRQCRGLFWAPCSVSPHGYSLISPRGWRGGGKHVWSCTSTLLHLIMSWCCELWGSHGDEHREYYHNLDLYQFADVSEERGPPLWSSGQSSWLQIRRPGFDSRHYQKKKEYWVWNEVHSASWVQLRSYLIEK
jgi:hypothetical protein